MEPMIRGNLYIGFLRGLRDDIGQGIGWTELATSRDGRQWTRYQEKFIDRNPRQCTWDHAMPWLGLGIASRLATGNISITAAIPRDIRWEAVRLVWPSYARKEKTMMKETATHDGLKALNETASAVETYIRKNLFDGSGSRWGCSGVMYSNIDSHTDKPFDRDFITALKVPARAEFDPWSYWSYEDSIMSMGLYLDGLMLQFQATGDKECMERADALWKSIEQVYSCSQVHGIGSFLRPYGGFRQMHRFLEPLGTDQASPLFCGLYRYLSHIEGERAEDVTRVMLNTLKWYEQQGFKSFYYKLFIHGGMRSICHSNSYFLPAVAWAATVEPEYKKWNDYLDLRLSLYHKGAAKLYPDGWDNPTFLWGSDLGVLKSIIGERFDSVFNQDLLDEAYGREEQQLAGYEKPGMFKRIFPESAAPGFVPYVNKSKEPVFGWPSENTVHHGRTYPGASFLLTLASIGYETEKTAAKAAGILAIRSSVPHDFTAYLSEDYDKLPESVHLSARSVGVGMVEWWRDYWLLNSILKANKLCAKA
jgi:hypothetical protein